MRTNKDKQLLRHILEYCSRVENAVKRIETEENLMADAFNQDALAMPLAQIGELARILSGQIDLTEIWDTAVNDIPELKGECMHIYQDMDQT